ncbi:MAG: phage tail sheath family protein, partial [Actinobacteria bacterium]|nr:phage tail sheath family protein [Actinomycetota bacterium]NIW32014.1 phage tail sheath family protein [Actinomycetota bacterium]
ARFDDVVEFVAPGVYVEEIPSGVRSIVAAETSVAAFVGGAASGPVDEPTAMISFSDYQVRFGAL